MPSLIRSERQTLRAIQKHILALKTRAGGTYTQISTVGALFHPNTTQPDLNLVTPHQGVAWTRNDDLNEAFDLLESRGRTARLQYLRGLFPDAFERQLSLYGLQKEAQMPIWVYNPIEGPFPADEVPFGRVAHQEKLPQGFSIQIAETREAMSEWLRTYRSAAYDVDLPGADRVELELLRNEQKQGHSVLLLGTHHETPIIAAKVTIDDNCAEIDEPMILADWAGMGFEDALLSFAVRRLLHDELRVIYISGDPGYHRDLYLRVGFTKMTHLTTFVRVKTPVKG